MFYQQPPVGRSINLTWSNYKPDDIFLPYVAHYYASGTAALAAAILASVSRSGTNISPEVILPAYCCPDIVSAALYAGAKPILVDFELNSPWFDLKQLESKINSNTVAIVAVNLFGINERFKQLRRITERYKLVLIEDSAQAFPIKALKDSLSGDFVIFSFGRGKAVNLLGGGLVLTLENSYSELLTSHNPIDKKEYNASKFIFNIKSRIYNTLTHPHLYWSLNALPFLHLGETIFKSLTTIKPLDSVRLGYLSNNIMSFIEDKHLNQFKISNMIQELNLSDSTCIDLPRFCNISASHILLRYPLLISSDIRDLLYQELERNGLGPSKMYPKPLNKIKGLENILNEHDNYPAADSFAERILTLPIHNGISSKDIFFMRDILTDYLKGA